MNNMMGVRTDTTPFRINIASLMAAVILSISLMFTGMASAEDGEQAVPVHTFMVFANGVEGREDEFNDWYEKVHLAEVLALPGFVSAQRFELVGDAAGGQKYLAVYELAGDPGAALAALSTAVESTMNMSDSMDSASVVTKLYSPRTEKMTDEE